MKYEHRDHISLIAVGETKNQKPCFLLNLNPSVFTGDELITNEIIVNNELKKLATSASSNHLSISPGLYIGVFSIRYGNVSFKKFNMKMSTDIFREYKAEVQIKMESFFGMEPELPGLELVPGEPTPAYVNQ